MRYTDAKEVVLLSENIIKDTESIVVLLEDLGEQLKLLEGSFLDDGIDEVKAFVKGFKNKTSVAIESADKVAAQLLDYADLLMKGK